MRLSDGFPPPLSSEEIGAIVVFVLGRWVERIRRGETEKLRWLVKSEWSEKVVVVES